MSEYMTVWKSGRGREWGGGGGKRSHLSSEQSSLESFRGKTKSLQANPLAQETSIVSKEAGPPFKNAGPLAIYSAFWEVNS